MKVEKSESVKTYYTVRFIWEYVFCFTVEIRSTVFDTQLKVIKIKSCKRIRNLYWTCFFFTTCRISFKEQIIHGCFTCVLDLNFFLPSQLNLLCFEQDPIFMASSCTWSFYRISRHPEKQCVRGDIVCSAFS